MTSIVVELGGDLDFSRREELARRLSAAERVDIAVIDLREATYIDSSVLSSLMLLKKHMAERGSAAVIRIAGANESLRRIFHICGLDRIFELYDSPDQACEGREAKPSAARRE